MKITNKILFELLMYFCYIAIKKKLSDYNENGHFNGIQTF